MQYPLTPSPGVREMPKKFASPKTTQPEPSEIALPEPATGWKGAASATVVSGAASATGDSGAASATGEMGAAITTGVMGAAITTGMMGAASATGVMGAASATGVRGAASATGKHSIALAAGFECMALAGESGAICIACRALDGSILAIQASKVGENGVKPDTWYRLDASGKFVEMEC